MGGVSEGIQERLLSEKEKVELEFEDGDGDG